MRKKRERGAHNTRKVRAPCGAGCRGCWVLGTVLGERAAVCSVQHLSLVSKRK